MKTRRLLLVAMSGVRIRNEELLALGMTLPGFVERGKVIASLPSLGALTLAGCLPPHWEPVYEEVDELTPEALLRLQLIECDLVAISSLSARINSAYQVADHLRECGKTVVIGGLHASVLPNEAALHADSVVVGEGERVFRTLISDFESGRLLPLYEARKQEPPDFAFDEPPLPRYDLLIPDKYNRITIQSTRGCPLDCAFCAASRLISPYRRKPLECVARELEAILTIWTKPFIELADDNTFVNKKWARELVRMLGSYPIRWFTESDISLADDDALLEMLAESGCAQVLVGLESTDISSLRETDARRWKERRRAKYLESIRKIQSYGISVNGCFILGFDSDGPGVFESTRDFVLESGLSEVQITVLTPFPGTALYQRLLLEGRLHQPAFWDKCTLFDVVYEPKQMSARELEDGFRWLAGELYSPEQTQRRKAHFRTCVRNARRRHERTTASVA